MRLHIAAIFVCCAALVFAADWRPADNPPPTPWTDRVSAKSALPDYPRPQMVRAKWTNVNGMWDYAISPTDEGRPAQFEGKLLVPVRGRIGAFGGEACRRS